MRVVLLVIFVALVARLVAVQQFSHTHYATLSRSELSQIVTVPALRGGIYDRNGAVLALSVAKKTVVADPFLIKKPLLTADALSPVLGVPVAQLVPELSEHSGFVYLAHRIDSATAAKVTALGLTGIDLIDESQRVQPDGQTAAPVVGAVQADGQGGSGLEYQYQSLLAGTAGTKDLLTAPDGVALPGASSTGKTAKAGTGLELTLDESIQYVAEQALGAEIVASQATGGTAVVMDVKTGDILAMANLQATPAPAPASGSAAAQTVAATTASATTGAASVGGSASTLPAGVSEAPSNAALNQVYEPGSVFKLVTFSAALANGVISPNQNFTVPDALPLGTYTFHDAESHGTENLSATDIIAQSSNIGTIEIAQQLGENRLLNQISNLGFGKPTGLHFPGESQGLVPGASQWTGSSIGSTPIGQADAVTVQQVLDAYNAVANGGVFVAPRLVRATVAPNGSAHAQPPSPAHRVIDPTSNAALVKMLQSVVSTGTGVAAAIDGYTVAGKTGTAQIPDPTHGGYLPGAFVGSFAGFAPAENPVLSCIVVLNHPTPIYGGSVAAPVFSTIVQYALQHYGIPTTAAATAGTSVGAVGGAGSIVVQPGVTTEGP
ncbi:MAG TPA: penicillin-binding protein 2 [Acidimicrobiales bacterium]|jgi:cell division protein FtsI (penicillin-binding protein 3)|nr:penicillin-binding protein 2 [Acidimicrobiales bacterium]